MNLLALDTSTEKATVALLVNGTLYQESQTGIKQQAQLLLPMIARLLASCGADITILDGIVYGRGPGSFTGLRVACSVAKGLAYAHNLPLYPVSSLETIIHATRQSVEHSNQAILAVMDARMKQLYWSFCGADGNALDEHVTDATDILIPTEHTFILAGVGFGTYLSQLPACVQDKMVSQKEIYPDAGMMIDVVTSKAIASVSAGDALPIYIRNQVTHGEPRG